MRSRITMDEIEELPMDELSSSSREDRQDVKRARFDDDAQSRSNPPMVDTSSLFPPPRSTRSLAERTAGISVSDALVDGPNGPVLYDDWRTSKKNLKGPANWRGYDV